ncbi:hypothetical protein EWH08_14405 [Sphingobium indicum]|uniref:Uncharacterized protein n=2 Tax=Sphingobium indicum TaxID=332055 RepID=A0A1L5BUR6_SPHIB|nr:hypothetical protein [Sphingobium indicum]APL96591.1 hypothetical protein SIDU_18250 [Sphingobium indicum B90A]KEY99640.1 hypothetical protein AI27_02170 [Sphingomonas sp. BHC-A]NYI23718.1 hypothetical protein [Sphingobium indicum]RYM00421.1 hypothetical protein EWH08_14405 [Sphingobium indicum]
MRSSALALLAIIPLTAVQPPAAAAQSPWYCGSVPPGWTPPWQRKPAPDDKNAPCHFIPCDRKKIRSETCR